MQATPARARGLTAAGKAGRELRRLTGALADIASDSCSAPRHLRSAATRDPDVTGCTCGESELAALVVDVAGRERALGLLTALMQAPGAPWLVPAVAAVRSLCEGHVYEAGRSLPALVWTSTRGDLADALRRARGAWAAGARWREVHWRTDTPLAAEPLEVVERATSEGACCELERRELVATVRVAARLG